MQTHTTFTNPVIKGFNPDPSIIRVNDDYFLCTSSFEFFPGVPIYHSKNLVNWELINYCLTSESQLDLNNCRHSGGIYAPTLRYHNGKFYMITTNVGSKKRKNTGNFFVYTDDIYGNWSAPTFIEHEGIDPSLFIDDDNKVYFCGTGDDDKGSGIVLFEINLENGNILSDKKVISRGCGGRNPEAPHIYKIDNMYYLLLAEGGTEYGHMITIQRSKNILGPYEPCPHNPIITHRDNYSHNFQCLGHGDLIQDSNDSWWMVFLGIRTTTGLLHHLGRETFLSPIVWKNGWPEKIDSVNSKINALLPNELLTDVSVFHTDFTESSLPLDFNWIRNPDSSAYILDAKSQCLHLVGKSYGLTGHRLSPTWTGIRQKDFNTSTSTCIRLNMENKTVAGLSAYYMDTHHYDLQIHKIEGEYYIELKKVIYDLESIVFSKAIAGEKIILRIRSDKEYYYFDYSISDETFENIGKGLTAALSTESSEYMTFTGTYLGIFAQNGIASFDYFHYEW
jgi:alpha-N-arabinofuranosidase